MIALSATGEFIIQVVEIDRGGILAHPVSDGGLIPGSRLLTLYS